MPANPVAHGSGAIRVNVHFADLHFALIILREFFDDGSDGAARTAPGCPKIHENRRVGLQHV